MNILRTVRNGERRPNGEKSSFGMATQYALRIASVLMPTLVLVACGNSDSTESPTLSTDPEAICVLWEVDGQACARNIVEPVEATRDKNGCLHVDTVYTCSTEPEQTTSSTD